MISENKGKAVSLAERGAPAAKKSGCTGSPYFASGQSGARLSRAKSAKPETVDMLLSSVRVEKKTITSAQFTGYHLPSAPPRARETKVERSQKGFSISETLLLHRVSAGESDAVRECIARFGGLVWSLARRVGLPEAELEDAVHEIFTELWRNGFKYDPSIASEAAFVAIIARRRLIDRRRKLNRRPVTQELNESFGNPLPPPTLRNQVLEEANVAAKAVATLSTEQQRVLRLSVYEGLSHELISRATGLPLGTVKTHARRGLMRLRELLSGGAVAVDGGGK